MTSIGDRTSPPMCGASSIATAGGPTAVPFRLCCAHSIIRAGAGGPTSVQCAALGAGAVETLPVPAAGRPAS
jgi:hypothetical protein